MQAHTDCYAAVLYKPVQIYMQQCYASQYRFICSSVIQPSTDLYAAVLCKSVQINMEASPHLVAAVLYNTV